MFHLKLLYRDFAHPLCTIILIVSRYNNFFLLYKRNLWGSGDILAFWHGRMIFWDISLQLWSAVIVWPQVVYSSSARELKMETVKPAASEKEEDDIDIDAIWDSEELNFFFLVLWLWIISLLD